MDAIRSRVTLKAVPKPGLVEKRRHLFKSSEWDLEEPAAFARIARSPFELALITGVVMRLFRAVVLTQGNASSTFLGASLVLGTLFLLGMATLHLGRFPVREWPSRVDCAAPRAVGHRARRVRRLAGDGDGRGFLARARRERVGAAARRHGVVHPRASAEGYRQGGRAEDASRWAAVHRKAQAG
jgi:hypothetical protein